MRSLGFLLGFFSIGAQVLLLRELAAAFGGSELLIGTALFGWLLAVALGAWLGGRLKRVVSPEALFVAGAVALPALVAAVRLAPLLAVDVVTEVVPFTSAALISVAAMLPLGFLSGWLFPTVSRRGWRPADATVTVYLFEGLGAFVGGAAITLAVGAGLSTTGAALAVGAMTLAYVAFTRCRRLRCPVLVTLAGAAAVVAARAVAPPLDRVLEGIRFAPLEVVAAFDTPYSRQTVLQRDSLLVLVTDGRVEATSPNLADAEQLLLPGLIQHPDARRVLLLGRAEFGVAQLAQRLPQLEITAIDPRSLARAGLDSTASGIADILRLESDAARLFGRNAPAEPFDLVILGDISPQSFAGCRHLAPEFLAVVRRWVAPRGILLVPTPYDTDRYVSDPVRDLLLAHRRCLEAVFPAVWLWPGESTLLMASSDASLSKVTPDSLAAGLERLGYSPVYLDWYRLQDRLQPFKAERLQAALEAGLPFFSDPLIRLPHLQAAFDAWRDKSFPSVVGSLGSPWWLLLIAAPGAALFAVGAVGRGRRARFGLWLFFSAGLLSIILELLVFFDFQMRSGVLYTDMAALVGAFMVGLSLGTYVSRKAPALRLERVSLAMLGVVIVAFLLTRDLVALDAIIAYYLLFLLITAAATGSLFVAATGRWCGNSFLVNPGAGYAFEIAGSALGALLTLTVLLPLLGLTGCLLSLIGWLAVSMLGSYVSAR